MKTIIIKVTVMIINGYWVINVDSSQVGYYLNFGFFSPLFSSPWEYFKIY